MTPLWSVRYNRYTFNHTMAAMTTSSYTITKRNGEEITFRTGLSLDQAAQAITPGQSEFTDKLLRSYRSGSGFPGWELWLLKVAQDKLFPPTGEYKELADTLHQFRVRGGLKKAMILNLNTCTVKTVHKGVNEGGLYVFSVGGEYLGKISKWGVMSGVGDQGVVEELKSASADPVAAAREFGHSSGRCACCRRDLSDPVSVWLGIGPICLERLAGPMARKEAELEYKMELAGL